MLYKRYLSGVEAVAGGVGPQADLLCRNLQHDWRNRHGYLERSPSQDGVRLQPDGPRLPRLGSFGQRPGGTEGTRYHWGRLREGLKEGSGQDECPVAIQTSNSGSDWKLKKTFLLKCESSVEATGGSKRQTRSALWCCFIWWWRKLWKPTS